MAILELKDICKDYIQGKEPVHVLKHIDLTVEQGDYLAIMGPSGSGKTTLMNIIGCLDLPTSGSYTLNGENLQDLSDDALAEIRNKYIGFVFQGFYLLPKMNALDNVVIPGVQKTIAYIETELDELEREDIFRLKKVLEVKKKKAALEKTVTEPIDEEFEECEEDKENRDNILLDYVIEDEQDIVV